MIVGASLDERVPVPCHVVSNPRDVSFDWNFSNSGERFEVTSGQFNLLQDFHSSIGDSDEFGDSASVYGGSEENLETIYELLYTPKSERDYGTLACWGKNSIGKQLEPCLFQVVPAAKPAPLRNCTLRPYSTLLGTPHGTTSNSSAASASSSSSSSSTSFYYGSHGSSSDLETAAAASASLSSSVLSSNGIPTIGQHYRESNYISTQFVKDRNVSNERTNITKFNQKSTFHGSTDGGDIVLRRREQIKQKNTTHGLDRISSKMGMSGSYGRISAPSHHRVGLTSRETNDDEEEDERGEPRVAAQISSALAATSASGKVRGSASASGSSSFSSSTGSFTASSSSASTTSDEENKRKTISNNERTSSMNLFNTVTLVEESFQSNSYSTVGTGNRFQAARTTPDANHRLAKREKRFNENLENEINKTHFDDDDEIFNSTTSGNQEDEDSIRTIQGSSSSISISSSSSSISSSTGPTERNNYHSTARELPIAAKLRFDNIRYHSLETGGSARHTGAAVGYNPSGSVHPFNHYMESVESSAPTTMELECVAGYDGGLPQHFFLEAYDSRTRKLRLNITSALSDVPLFRIDLSELIPSESYTPTLHLIAL
ncbi:uncharacterized protein LOC110681093 [Aedes aegypti]|uniref:Uncharacterized protein n=1 Tax=Aedes aegypti TaxID=7159 RepID=A0A903VPB3_AEDAE|nr:uncharacterized protein LOC110681093 [Aedes aegypti]